MKGIRAKIVGGFLLVVLLMIGYAIYSIWNVQQSNQAIHNLQSEDLPMLIATERMAFNVANRLAVSNGYLLTGMEVNVAQFAELTEESKEIEAWIIENTNDENLLYLIEKTREWTAILENEVFPLYRSGDTEQALLTLFSKATSPARFLITSFQETAEEERSKVTTKLGQIDRAGVNLQQMTTGIAMAVILLSIIIGIVISGMIVKPLKILLERVNLIATGDLSGDEMIVNKKDEIGLLTIAFNEMRNSLRRVISKTSSMSEQVAATAEQLSASSQETSAATDEIASTIQSVTETSEHTVTRSKESTQSALQVSDGVEKITFATAGASELAENAAKQASDGEQAIGRAVNQIRTIHETVSESAKLIQQLGERSKEIGNILGLITSISEQTNLLALNAAIEAARAGEHGKGFAVVADEVRKLAEESRVSAEKISTMIQLIQADTKKAVEEMTRGTEEVEIGTKVVNEVGESFTSILNAVNQVTNEMYNVSNATQQIAMNAIQLNEALAEMEESSVQSAEHAQSVAASTEEQLASMEEIASSAEMLNQLANELREEVTKFKV
ncbi:methyl-accepting chemotaxis protein [Halalkalibacter nanhaiisediminis]|uniref:Methyl-accepting chemotaxis protein n=1 Tax=Halalkalibacter nanhaiisediminis TaxID=688079 RepID=A0A562QSJ9_9BACI|nr:methyl-accepting chemotaxis protein [Halalkalibacter nanhaiisediminis]TWI59714.1 methyl-accepting chemotaxis protein [Halalkalibacter nanhaiisediminis]